MIIPKRITKQEAIEIKHLFGHRYAPAISEYLKQYGITNKDGSDVKTGMIRRVVGGKYHEEIQEGIFRAWADHKNSKNIISKTRKKLLYTKKAVADTTA